MPMVLLVSLATLELQALMVCQASMARMDLLVLLGTKVLRALQALLAQMARRAN